MSRRPTDSTAAFYKRNHERQTYDFVLRKKREYGGLTHVRATVWDMVEKLDTIVDQSDPDINLPQSHHAYQVAEALRQHGQPDWLVLVGFIHDLGKVLSLWEPQWAVVGDIFPVGCEFEDTVIHHEFFAGNPDSKDSRYNTKHGVYSPHCGFDNVNFSMSHDWYLWKVLESQSQLPREALYIIRYHSFYAHHTQHGYQHLASPEDHDLMRWVKLFQPYDLYSKVDTPVTADPAYYRALVEKYIPGVLSW